jgi:DNA-binding NtrC family response regulator
MIGSSVAAAGVRRLLERFAPLPLPVLIRGETGTGKELAARRLHELGPRRAAPFVAINCATVGGDLASSALFGHVRGAFTGATADRAGVFARAGPGTVFLDELGELPLTVQAHLLRVVEQRVVTPVGSDTSQPIDARIVTATHRDLDQMVRRGVFREDLYHRLAVLVVELPPLRARPGDIVPLLEHFATLATAELGRPIELTPAALAAARYHPWLGNVRALKNALLRAGALADGPITAELLLGADAGRMLPAPSMHRVSPPRTPAHDHVALPRGDYRTMNHALLRNAVAEHGSINRAAKALGIPRSTLSAWLRRLSAG